MTIEVELVGARRDKVGYVNRRVSRKKRSNNSSKRSLTSKRAKRRDEPMALQRLYDSCRHVFKGPGTVPPPSDVQKLRHILDGMLPEDVGLSRELQFFKPSSAVKGVQRVTYTTIYKCENFSLSIFFLPANAVIPLHNHPEMTVFSKLLLGTMHIKAYDWVDPINLDDSRPPSNLRLARLKANSAFTAPCDTSVLYPTSGGNIHACRAITPCAFLDVMGPPYSKEDGRDCSYYKEYPHTAFSNGGTMIAKEDAELHGWLEEIDMPPESAMDGIDYMGPQINETNF